MPIPSHRLVAVLVVGLLATACGGSSSDESGGDPAPRAGSTSPVAAAPTRSTSPAESSVGSSVTTGAETKPPVAMNEIVVAGFAFGPQAVTVSAGSTVTWTNEDDTLHTVTFKEDPSAFGGPLDGAGTTVEVTFDESGTYTYFCSIHPTMTGTVEVS